LLDLPELAEAPDGAVLAAAFEAWGHLLSSKVIGEYAYVAFSKNRPGFVAGQDSLGVRRIYLRRVDNRYFVASNLALLFQVFPDSRPPLDAEVLPEYFVGPMTPWSGRTVWKGVSELIRGHVFVHAGDEIRTIETWSPNVGSRVHSNSDDADAEFRHHLFEAVRCAFDGSGPVLCDLSGGFDSSTVCSVASTLAAQGCIQRPIVTWSYSSARSNSDKFQDAVRQRYGLRGECLKLEDHAAFACFTDSEIPTGSFVQMGALNRALRTYARAHGIRSRITGQGGDALLQKAGGGPPIYLAEWFRSGRLRDWLTHARGYVGGGSFNMWRLLRYCMMGTLDFQPGVAGSVPNWIRQPFLRRMRASREDSLRRRPTAFSSHARERAYRWTQCFISYPTGHWPEARVPLVHRPLVEFLLNTDWLYLMEPNRERVMLKRSVGSLLPEMFWGTEQCQTAFSASFYQGLRSAWPRIEGCLTGQRLGDLGVVEPRLFREALEAMRAGYQGPNPQLTKTALYLEAWLGIRHAATQSDDIYSSTFE